MSLNGRNPSRPNAPASVTEHFPRHRAEEFWNERLSALKRAAEREHAYQINKDRQEDV
jgi:hypothetical protein